MDGAQSRRDQLEKKLRRAERHKDKKKIAEIAADLELPPFPKLLGYLWRIYHRIRRRIPMGFAGPDPIRWSDLDAFVRRTGIELLPWECLQIEAIDNLYIESAAGGRSKAAAPVAGKSVKSLVSIDDAEGIKTLMGSIGVRKVVRRNKGKSDG